MHNPIASHDSQSAAATDRQPSQGASRPALSTDNLRQYTDSVENLILKYPGAALASAFFVGVLVAWLIKRK